MALPSTLDHDKLTEVALALLGLTARTDRGVTRAWKGMDWDLTDALFERGWIGDPHGPSKSVVLTDEGARLAEEFLKKHFARQGGERS